MHTFRGAVAFDFSAGHEAELVRGSAGAARVANAPSEAADGGQNLERALASAESHEIIRSAIGGLTRSHAAVILARYFDGLTFREIGDVFGVSEVAVHKMHGRALARLRVSLELMGVDRLSHFEVQ
jgi:RNA polymerase sigma factor (sigma-70 family)